MNHAQSAVEAMRAGAFDYVLKPFKLALLLPTLERALEVQQLRREKVQLEAAVAIHELIQTIAMTLDPQQIAERTAVAAVQQSRSDESSVLLYREETEELEVVAALGGPERVGTRTALGQGIAGWVAAMRQPLTLDGPVHDERFTPLYRRPEIRHALTVPMLNGGRLVGVLSVNATTRTRPFVPGEARALGILAGAAAAALETARLHGTVAQQEARFRKLAETTPDGILLVDHESRVVWANPQALALQGVPTIEAAAGRPGFEFLLPDEQAQAQAELARVLAGEVSRGLVYHVKAQGGAILPVEANSSRLPAPPGEKPQAVTVLRDISERMAAKQRIETQLQRLSGLRAIDNAITSTFDLRVSLDVLLEQAQRLLGIDAANVLLLHPESTWFEVVASRGFVGHMAGLHFALRPGPLAQIALERRLQVIPDLRLYRDQMVRPFDTEHEHFASFVGCPLLAKGELRGVLCAFTRTALDPEPDWLDFLQTLASQAAVAVDSAQLMQSLQRAHLEVLQAYDATLEGWTRALDLRDDDTEGHTQRVTELTIRLARAHGVAPEQMADLRRGALLHDIGKIGVPDAILRKPGPLDEAEWEVMRRHPVYAFEMLAPISFLRGAIDVPYCHHEKWNGRGYPRGLKGEQIPLGARLFAVVDVWDALTSDRPYRKAWTPARSREQIRADAGTHFDPRVVETFLKLLDEEEATLSARASAGGPS